MRSISIMIILIFFPFLTLAQDCPVTTTWNEQDLTYFNINPTDALGFTIINDYDSAIPSSYTQFYVATNSHPTLGEWR